MSDAELRELHSLAPPGALEAQLEAFRLARKAKSNGRLVLESRLSFGVAKAGTMTTVLDLP